MIISLNGINHLIFVMVMCGVLFEVWTDFLSIIKTSIGFRVLNMLMKSWVLVPCGFVDKCQCCRETCCLHLQGLK
jgi:hypothetical protein